MAGKKFWLGILALVFGMAVAGCDSGTGGGGGGTDKWTAVAGSTFGTSRINAIAYGNGTFVAASDHTIGYANW